MGLLNFEVWKNQKGTSDRRCVCGSWKQHWEKFSYQTWPSKCSVAGCHNSAEVGAHVYRPGVSNQEYIIPMCKSCNGTQDFFTTKPDIVAISANVSETCEKNIQTPIPVFGFI